jgi:hypothetical protein
VTANLLLSVGCDAYQSLPTLSSAHSDARNVFSALTTSDRKLYSAANSTLLLSPSTSELRSVLSALSEHSPIDVLTIFFAGHGRLKAGSFYLCCSDSRENSLSSTAISLTSLLDVVNELSPRSANLVIDACESGGMSLDIQRALKPDLFGAENSTAISLLAACGRDQEAFETPMGGDCTGKLLACVDGTRFVQDLTPDLELLEISRCVAEDMAALGEQSPIYWGLNLTGKSSFSANPHASTEGLLRKALASAKPLRLSPQVRQIAWDIRRSVQTNWVPSKVRDLISSVAFQPDCNSIDGLAFARQVELALIPPAREDTDPFRELEVRVACFAPFIDAAASNPAVASYLIESCKSCIDSVIALCPRILSSLENEPYCLLGEGGFSELFFLPLRLTDTLGWLGTAAQFGERFWGADAIALSVEAAARIVDEYALSIIPISDRQAAAVAACIAGTRANEVAITVTSLMLASAAMHRGGVARTSLPPRDVLPFLLKRHERALRPGDEMLACPSELLAVLISAAPSLGLNAEADELLPDLDRIYVNAFLPESYKSFGASRIEKGINITRRVGFDFWDCESLANQIYASDLRMPENDAIEMASVLSSLVFRDRVPWFLLQRLANKDPTAELVSD